MLRRDHYCADCWGLTARGTCWSIQRWDFGDKFLKLRYPLVALGLMICSGALHGQSKGDQTFLLRGKCSASSSIEEDGKVNAYNCDSAVYTENAVDGDAFVQFVASQSPDDPPFAFAGDLTSGRMNVARVYMRQAKATPVDEGICFINRATNGNIKSIACGAKASKGNQESKIVVGFEVSSQQDISEGVSVPQNDLSSRATNIGNIKLNCSGYSGLVHANQTFKFDISESTKSFTGAMNSLREISGRVSLTGDVLILTFEDRTNMQYTAWIDRSDGSFKLDRSNDKIYLPNDVTGTCAKSSGNAF